MIIISVLSIFVLGSYYYIMFKCFQNVYLNKTML